MLIKNRSFTSLINEWKSTLEENISVDSLQEKVLNNTIDVPLEGLNNIIGFLVTEGYKIINSLTYEELNSQYQELPNKFRQFITKWTIKSEDLNGEDFIDIEDELVKSEEESSEYIKKNLNTVIEFYLNNNYFPLVKDPSESSIQFIMRVADVFLDNTVWFDLFDESHQKAMRFIKEYASNIYKDDPLLYEKLSGRILEYVFRNLLGVFIYKYDVTENPSKYDMGWKDMDLFRGVDAL